MDCDEIIKILGLKPLEPEGGYFLETYRATETIETSKGTRAYSTAIYYLLKSGTASLMHRIIYDEVFHFYLGDPVEQMTIYPDGSFRMATLGSDISAQQSIQLVVPGGTWQGARLKEGGKFALLGTTVAPGFSYEDFELGDTEELAQQYPRCANFIHSLRKM